MRGDILLYRSSGSLFDRLISWRTQGPFVHVAVDLGDGTMIDARLHEGVTRHAVQYGNTLHIPLSHYTTPDRIEAGIAFLLKQVQDKAKYSLWDILDNIWLLHKLHLFIGESDAYDCSHLVAQYLDYTGGIDLGLLTTMLDSVSPNDIYRAWCAQQHGTP